MSKYSRPSLIDARRAIAEIHSIVYTLKILEKITNQKIGTDFRVEIEDLRSGWFERDLNDSLRRLIKLLKKSADLNLEITVLLSRFLKNNLGEGNLRLLREDLFFENGKYHIVFRGLDDWNKDLFLKEFLVKRNHISRFKFLGKKNRQYYLILPLELSYFLLAYASQEGEFSNRIKSCLFNNHRPDILWNEGIKRHVEAINRRYSSRVVKEGHGKIPFSYGLKA